MNNQELNRLRMLAGTAKATSNPEYTTPKTVQQIMEHYVPVEEAYGNDVDRRAIDNADREPKKKVSVKPAPWDKEIDEASSSPQSGSIESYIHTPEADDVPVTVHYEIDTAEPDVNYGGGIHLHVEDANGNEVEISSADQDRFEQEVNDKGQDDMDEYGDYEMHRRQDNAMESSDEDSEIARMSALAGLDKEPKKKVSVKKAPWDDELEEGAKPDFADIDDDGDKDETAKKAADDKEAMSEQQQMREWSNSVYKQYEDRGHVMAQPEGETVDLSLRRYLNAEPSKVSIEEDITVESLAESYNKFKGKK